MTKLPFHIKFGVLLIYLISKTWRISINYPSSKGVVAFWHGEMLPLWYSFGKYNSYALVSASKDGEILTALLELWGISVIRGSSSSGGKEALNLMIEYAKKDNFILITPDGPKGPANKIKAGAIITAIRANIPLYFARVNIKFAIKFNKSWDKFIFPMPFSRININFIEETYEKRDYDRKEVNDIISKLEDTVNN